MTVVFSPCCGCYTNFHKSSAYLPCNMEAANSHLSLAASERSYGSGYCPPGAPGILTFFPFHGRISSSNMKVRWFIFYPFDKFLYVLIFQDALYRVVIIKQLPLRERSVYLSVTNSMKEYYVPTFKCAGDQMMFAWFFSKSAIA